MRCIGVDPSYGKPVAYAWRTDRFQWKAGTVDPADIFGNFRSVFREAIKDGIDGVVIEDGFVGQNKRVSMELERARAHIEAAAMSNQLDVVRVAPATWQSAMLSQGSYHPKTHREIVRMLDLRVRRGYGLNLKEDEQVAVLLAEWGEAQRGMP